MTEEKLSNEIMNLKNLLSQSAKALTNEKEVAQQLKDQLTQCDQSLKSEKEIKQQLEKKLFRQRFFSGVVIVSMIFVSIFAIFSFQKLSKASSNQQTVENISLENKNLKQKILDLENEKSNLSGKYFRIDYTGAEEESAIVNFLSGTANRDELFQVKSKLAKLQKFDGLKKISEFNLGYSRENEISIRRNDFLKNLQRAVEQNLFKLHKFEIQHGFLLVGGERVPRDKSESLNGVMNCQKGEELDNCYLLQVPKRGAIKFEQLFWDGVYVDENK